MKLPFLKLKIGRDHFRNMINVRQFLAKKYLMKLNKQTRRDEWATGPAVINAYYDPRLNSISEYEHMIWLQTAGNKQMFTFQFSRQASWIHHFSTKTDRS